jgi:hypothetical protein
MAAASLALGDASMAATLSYVNVATRNLDVPPKFYATRVIR